MKSYTLSELSTPETYQNDPDLERLCRQTINARFSELGCQTRAEARDAVFGGRHPEWVASLLAGELAKQETAQKTFDDAAKTVATLTPPLGYSVEIEAGNILIHGEYNEDLHERIKRKGGYWDGKSHSNRRCLVLPINAAASLKRMFANSQKATAQKKIGRNEYDILRWLGFVEEKAQIGYLYEKGVETCRSLGIDAFPELNERLRMAIAKSKSVAALQGRERNIEKTKRLVVQWLGYIKENIRNGKGWYSRGESVVIEQISILKAAKTDVAGYEAELERLREEFRKAQTGGYEGQTYWLCGGSGYGCNGWTPGQVVANDKSRIAKGEPDFLYVLSADKSYVREDGLSFGVGDESGYVYSAICRSATDDEAAPLIARIAEGAARRKAMLRLEEIAGEIRETGTRPEGANPSGDEIRMPATTAHEILYGYGEWFVIGQDGIWFVKNNGADGDDWSLNNVRTGGAGAIGWVIPFREELANEIREMTLFVGKDTNAAAVQRLAAHLDDGNREV